MHRSNLVKLQTTMVFFSLFYFYFYFFYLFSLLFNSNIIFNYFLLMLLKWKSYIKILLLCVIFFKSICICLLISTKETNILAFAFCVGGDLIYVSISSKLAVEVIHLQFYLYFYIECENSFFHREGWTEHTFFIFGR